jgi:hypothetical protein
MSFLVQEASFLSLVCHTMLLDPTYLNIVLCLRGNIHDCCPKCFSNILFSVHHISVVWKEQVVIIREPSQARLMSPHMLLTISHKATLWIDEETIFLLTNLGTSPHQTCEVCHCNTFCKVFDVSSEWMVKR